MPDPASPIDELLDGLRAALAARTLVSSGRIARAEAALGSYRRAVEAQIAAEFAAEHRLKMPVKTGLGVARAAEELKRALLELPELAQLFAADESAPREPAPSSLAPRVVKEPQSESAPLPSSRSEAAGPLVRLRAALTSQKLVIIGALTRDRSEALPGGLAEHTEWIDTVRDGVHALGNLAQRIRQGRVAALIILDRAVKHKHSEPALAAARDAHVPAAFAGQGGRASLERALTQIEGMLAP
jgi:hypothetical protein